MGGNVSVNDQKSSSAHISGDCISLHQDQKTKSEKSVLEANPDVGFKRASELFSVDKSHPALHTSLTPPGTSAFPHPSLSKGCKAYFSLQSFGGIKCLHLPPKRQQDYREKTWWKVQIYDCYSWLHEAGGRRSAPSCPSLSKGCNGPQKHKFCHLQTILCLGRAEA